MNAETDTTIRPAAAAMTALKRQLETIRSLDPDKIRAGYTPDAVVRLGDGAVLKQEAMDDWLRKRCDMLSLLSFRPERIETAEASAAVEWWAGKQDEESFLEGRDEFVFDAEGRIREHRVVRDGRTERPHSGICYLRLSPRYQQ